MNNDPFYSLEKKRYKDPIPSREYIMQQFKKNATSKALTITQVFTLLQVKAVSQKDALQNRLRAMVRDAQLKINRSGRYALGDIKSLVRGEIRFIKDQPILFTEQGDELPIDPQKIVGYLPYDNVVARPVEKSGSVICTSIVELKERRLKCIIGQIERQSSQTILLPANKSIQTAIVINNDNRSIPEHSWVSVKVGSGFGRKYMHVDIHEVFGDNQTPRLPDTIVENCYDLDNSIPDDVQSELDAIPNEIPAVERVTREDWTLLPFITIDGKDSKDFDDAICVCRNEEDGWLVYIAIADVSHYVRPGTKLDAYAYKRSTSVYLPSKVYPMIPEKLSNNLCSLRPDVERLVVGLCIHVDKLGSILKTKVTRAVIKSHMRCTYQQVEDMLHDQTDTPDWLNWPLRDLNECVDVLSKAHSERRGLDFSSTQQNIVFDKNGLVDSVSTYDRLQSHIMIERLMVLANNAVATKLSSVLERAIYRHHPSLADDALDKLSSIADNIGLGKVKDPADFLSRIHEIADSDYYQMMLMRLLPQAFYSTDATSHFGLGLEAYTHFTSPIRRYPDLIVHRLILSTEGIDKSPMPSRKLLVSQARYTSRQERLADQAGYDALDWYKCQFAERFQGQEFQGVISTVVPFGCFIKIAKLGIEGLMHVSVLPGDYYVYDEINQTLVGRNAGFMFQCGDRIEVKISHVDMLRRCIDFAPTKSS